MSNIVLKKWVELKRYISFKSDLNYKEFDDKYIINLHLNNIIYYCILNKNDNNELDDVKDFEDNYKESCGGYPSLHLGLSNYQESYFFVRGYRLICSSGVNEFYINFNKNVILVGGFLKVIGNISGGDKFSIYCVDKDNILGYGEDFVLYKIIKDYYFCGDGSLQREEIVIDSLNAGFELNNIFYLKVIVNCVNNLNCSLSFKILCKSIDLN